MLIPKSPRKLSIASKIVLPWGLLLVFIGCLIAFHYWQTMIATESEQHGRLHLKAVLIAEAVRKDAIERWARVQYYATVRDASLRAWLRRSQEDTDKDIVALSTTFENSTHRDELVGTGQSRLESYVLARGGHPELYEAYLDAVDRGDRAQQERLHGLLSSKLRLVLATLDDLNEYHRKTEEGVSARRIKKAGEDDTKLYFLIFALGALGMVFARFQTRSIAIPLADLTATAHAIEKGEEVSLDRFSGSDEIGQLSQALGGMVVALKRANEELNIAYAEIEEKVRRRTDELAHRTTELELANRDLEGFSYSVSHDLRAPLRAIDGFIAILDEDYGDKFDSEARRLFGIVQSNARKMGELIDDILAFSRASRLEIAWMRIDMNAMVDEVWQALAEERKGRVVEFHRDELPPVVADPRAMRQIWQNLLSNAIKFSRPRATAHIAVEGRRWQDSMIEYSVRDDGVGFNPAYVGKLFGLFQRLHGMDEFEGTGVGLCLVKRFVQKHHGEVIADGALDAGATLGFRLPDIPLPASGSAKEEAT